MIEVKYNNILVVDGVYMDLRYPRDPQVQAMLDDVLGTYGDEIITAIEKMYMRQLELNPNAIISKGSIFMGVLATTVSLVTTVERESSVQNVGVFVSREHIKEPYLALWDIVLARGLAPEVRTNIAALQIPYGPGRQNIPKGAVHLLVKSRSF